MNFEAALRFVPEGDPAAAAPGTPIRFWLEGSVRQSSGWNYGVFRAAGDGTMPAAILVMDSAGASRLQRGLVHTFPDGDAHYGRSMFFDEPPFPHIANPATGNAPGSAPFPSEANNQNGAIDLGYARIYGMAIERASADMWSGDGDPPDPADLPGLGGSSLVPSDGVTWSAWQRLYAIDVLVPSGGPSRQITLSAELFVTGIGEAAFTSWPSYQLYPGESAWASTTYQWTAIPSPPALWIIAAVWYPHRRRQGRVRRTLSPV